MFDDVVQRFRSVGAGEVISDLNAIAAAQERMGRGGAGGNQAAIDYWQKVGGAANMAATAMGGVAAAGVVAGGWALKGAMDSEQAMARMNVAFKGNKAAAKEAYEWAKKYADVTPFETPEVVGTAQRMKLATNEYQKWTELTGKLAAGMGKPLDEAAMAVQKVLSGSSEGMDSLQMTFGIMRSALSEAGWTGSMKTKEDITSVQKALESVINTRFGNAIEEQAATAAGRISTLKGSISNLQIALGQQLMPEFKSAIEVVNTWVDSASKMGEEDKQRLITLMKLGVEVGAVGVVFLKGVSIMATFKAGAAARSLANIEANLAEAASANAMAGAYTEAAGAARVQNRDAIGRFAPGFKIGEKAAEGGGLLKGINSALAPLTAMINPLTMGITALLAFIAVYQTTVKPAQVAAAAAAGDAYASIGQAGTTGLTYDPSTNSFWGPAGSLPPADHPNAVYSGARTPSAEQFTTYMKDWVARDRAAEVRTYGPENFARPFGALGTMGIDFDKLTSEYANQLTTKPLAGMHTGVGGASAGDMPFADRGENSWVGLDDAASEPWSGKQELRMGIMISDLPAALQKVLADRTEEGRKSRAAYRSYLVQQRATIMERMVDDTKWDTDAIKDLLEKGSTFVEDAVRMGGQGDPSFGQCVQDAGQTAIMRKFSVAQGQRSQFAGMMLSQVEASFTEQQNALELQGLLPYPTLVPEDLDRKMAKLVRESANTMDGLRKAIDSFDIAELQSANDAIERFNSYTKGGGGIGTTWANLWNSLGTQYRYAKSAAEIIAKTDPVAGRKAMEQADLDLLRGQQAYNDDVDRANAEHTSIARSHLQTVLAMEKRAGRLQTPAELAAAPQAMSFRPTTGGADAGSMFNLPFGFGDAMHGAFRGVGVLGAAPEHTTGSLGAPSITDPKILAVMKQYGLSDYGSSVAIRAGIEQDLLRDIDNANIVLTTAIGAYAKDAAKRKLWQAVGAYQSFLDEQTDKDKGKGQPSIAREILSTGGISGLAQAGISQVVSGGYSGWGRLGYRGPFSLSGAGADMIRASSTGEKEKQVELRVFLDKGLKSEIVDESVDRSVRVVIQSMPNGAMSKRAVP